MMKKYIAFILVIIMCIPVLFSCGIKPEDSRIVMTVDGEKIYYDYYRYVFLNTKDDLAYGRGDDYWEDSKACDKLRDSVLNTIVHNKAIMNITEEYDIRLTKKDKKRISAYIDARKEELGGKDKFAESLKEAYLTEFSLNYIQKFTMIWDKVFRYVTDEKSGIIKSSDKVILEDIPENFRNFRYVMISNDKNDSPEDNLALAEKVKDLADSGSDFKELIKEYGEDETMRVMIDTGYYFTFGSIAEDIEKVISELDENEISDVIDMGYGYYVIQRLPIDDDYVDKNFEDFRASYCARIFNEMVEKESSRIKVKYRDLYDELNISNIK